MKKEIKLDSAFNMAGLFSLSLRLVVGWTYFSALWRRLILADKLNPDSAGYIGEKFNHFLPNALGIKPMIEYLVTHPDTLWWAMVIFTIVEGIVGLLLLFGLFTRLASIGVFLLALGILLGSGWIGTTCLDEWQIGVLGIAAGFTLFFTGSGYFSLDHYLLKKNIKLSRKKFFNWFGSGELPLPQKRLKRVVFSGSMLILFMTLFTNQYFHGGLWGDLHNKSVHPKIEIPKASINPDDKTLSITIYRTEGVDVYGSFLIGIKLSDQNGKMILEKNMEDLAQFPVANIQNDYVTQVKPGAHSLIVPLGAKATLSIQDSALSDLAKGTYTLSLVDISGKAFVKTIAI